MMKKYKVHPILIIVLIMSLSLNLVYLKDSKSKYMYSKDRFRELHGQFVSTVNTLYRELYENKRSGFKDKEAIQTALNEAIDQLHLQFWEARGLNVLSGRFYDDYYYDYVKLNDYLRELWEKETFTEEEFQSIKEIYRIVDELESDDITERKFLYIITPTQAYDAMFEKINNICDEEIDRLR